jgi:hypothetical protein
MWTLGERQAEPSNQAMRGRFEGQGGEGAAEVGLMDGSRSQAGGVGIRAQPPQRALIASGEQNHGVGRAMPLGENRWMREREVAGGVNRLTGLGSRREVSAGDQIETALEVRHVNHGT